MALDMDELFSGNEVGRKMHVETAGETISMNVRDFELYFALNCNSTVAVVGGTKTITETLGSYTKTTTIENYNTEEPTTTVERNW